MEYLIYLGMILLLGTLGSALANQLKVSNVFFLILIGMSFGAFGIISFSNGAIITISIITLILVVFDGTNRLSFEHFFKYSKPAIKLTFSYFLLNLVIVSFATSYLFGINILLAAAFASLIYGIDPTVLGSIFGNRRNRDFEILKVEAIINTPLSIIIPVMFLQAISKKETLTIAEFTNTGFGGWETLIIPFMQQVLIGVGAGIVAGYFIITILKKNYMENLSYIAIISAAVVAYVAAEVIDGSGVLAVTFFGLIFGNSNVRQKVEIKQFTSKISQIMALLVFILIGTMLLIPAEFILKGTLLFVIYLVSRYIAVHFFLENCRIGEKIFITANAPKGIEVVVVILLMYTIFNHISDVTTVIYLSMLFVLYGVVLSTASTALFMNSKKKKNKLKKVNQ